MIFLCSTLDTILESGYLGLGLPKDCTGEAEKYVEEGVLESGPGGCRLTDYGRESLLDWIELEYGLEG